MTVHLELIRYSESKEEIKESIHFLEEIYEYKPIEKKKKRKQKPINYYLQSN